MVGGEGAEVGGDGKGFSTYIDLTKCTHLCWAWDGVSSGLMILAQPMISLRKS